MSEISQEEFEELQQIVQNKKNKKPQKELYKMIQRHLVDLMRF